MDTECLAPENLNFGSYQLYKERIPIVCRTLPLVKSWYIRRRDTYLSLFDTFECIDHYLPEK